MIKRKIFKQHKSGAITFPLKILEIFDFRIGDEVELIFEEKGKITIRKIGCDDKSKQNKKAG